MNGNRIQYLESILCWSRRRLAKGSQQQKSGPFLLNDKNIFYNLTNVSYCLLLSDEDEPISKGLSHSTEEVDDAI